MLSGEIVVRCEMEYSSDAAVQCPVAWIIIYGALNARKRGGRRLTGLDDVLLG